MVRNGHSKAWTVSSVLITRSGAQPAAATTTSREASLSSEILNFEIYFKIY